MPGGDRIIGPLGRLREAMTRRAKERLLVVLETVEKLKEDLEELGHDVEVDIKDTPQDKPPGIVLHLTAIIRQELEEDLG